MKHNLVLQDSECVILRDYDTPLFSLIPSLSTDSGIELYFIDDNTLALSLVENNHEYTPLVYLSSREIKLLFEFIKKQITESLDK